MSGASRRKGLSGEHEVKALLEAHGFTVRGLEGGGDHIATKLCVERQGYSELVHLAVECKRSERASIWEWLLQAQTEAPEGVPSLLFFRRNRSRWQIAGDADVLLGLIAR